jgi:hypothetical protein
MTGTRGRFLRDNAFLVASVLLPVVVVGFFLIASAIPRWTVPPPRYDIVLRSPGPYDQARPRVAVDFAVRHGRVEATVRALPAAAYPQISSLFLFDHTTGYVRRIAVDVPQDMGENDPPRTFVVEALADRRALDDTRSPDGYELQARTNNSPGIIGDLFGMHRYELRAVLVNRGRVVTLDLPPPYEYQTSVNVIGWLEPREVR